MYDVIDDVFPKTDVVHTLTVFFWCFDPFNQLGVNKQGKHGDVVWYESKVWVGEIFVAARNVCVNMVQGIASPGGGVDMLVEFR